MTSATSCTVGVLHQDGTPIDMIPWGKEPGWSASARCGDCGVVPGAFHHPGCDLQRCPRCGGQMLLCDCRFDEDGPDDDEDGPDDDEDGDDGELFVDSNGRLTERRWFGGQEVLVHYDDIPETDITTVQGIRCTTALRTVIDIAPDVDSAELERIVRDCLERRLFTVEEARARIAEHDMLTRRGAELLRRALPR